METNKLTVTEFKYTKREREALQITMDLLSQVLKTLGDNVELTSVITGEVILTSEIPMIIGIIDGLHRFNCFEKKSKKKDDDMLPRECAKAFYRALCYKAYGDVNRNSQGIMSVELIADIMEISLERASELCDTMIKYGVTERCNGMIVV